MPRKVAVLVGSLRKESFSRKLASAFSEFAPAELAFEQVDISGLSFYNQDDEERPPAPWVVFRDAVRSTDAVLFVTPEYNRSVPAVLKNAIDVGSRPYGKSVWDRKPAGIVSSSPGPYGGFGANHHLRQSLVFLNMPALQQPEAYINQVSKIFDESGKITAEPIRQLLGNYFKTFAAWIETNVPK